MLLGRRQAVEVAVGDALARLVLVCAEDQAQVVDAGGLTLGVGLERLRDLDVDVTADLEGERITGRPALEVDGDAGQVLGVVAELDLTADQGRINLVAVAELCRVRHSSAYAEFRIMPSRPRAELFPSSPMG